MFAAMQAVTTKPAPLLRILGTGEDEEDLKQLVETKGLADRVEFLGFRDDALAHMRAADLFVLSSRWEGFANVIVEAMAMGTAVVATDCPHGPAEIITDGLNGRLVPVRNPKALARVIDEVLADPKSRADMAAAGVVRAEDFGVSAIAGKYATSFRNFSASSAAELV